MTFVFVAVVMSAAVDVSVEAGAPCVTRPSLESALTTRGLQPGKGGLDVRVSGSPSQLVLTASRGAQKFDRTVPVERGDCDAVTRVVVALIQSWATAPRTEATRVDGGAALARESVSSDGGASPFDASGSATRPSAPGDSGTAAAGAGATLRVTSSSDGGASAEGASSTTRGSPSRDGGAPRDGALSAVTSTTRVSTSGDVGGSSTTRAISSRDGGASRDGALSAAASTTRASTSGDVGGSSTTRAISSRDGGASREGALSAATSTTRGSASSESGASPDGASSTTRAASSRDGGASSDDATPAASSRDGGPSIDDASSTTRTASSSDAGAVETADPLLARIGTTGTQFEPTAADAGATGSPRLPLSLDVIALGGIGNDPLSQPEPVTTGIGQLALRGAIGRWGLLIDGGFDSARTRTIGDITATASSQWLSLSVSVAFQPLERFSLDLALGVRGWRFGGTATGVDNPSFQRFLSLGGVLSAGFNLKLVGPLHAQLRPWLSLRGNRGAFVVENGGTFIPIEPLTFGALLGALLRFD